MWQPDHSLERARPSSAHDRVAYTHAKTEFIENMTKQAKRH